MSPAWLPGNRLTLLENGEAYFPRVFAAIAAARREVLIETFILFDDAVGRQLQQALLQAAQRGARVRVLVDGWGSPDIGADYLAPLLAAGVQLRAFEPARRLFGTRLNPFRRMHRKIVVVDGERAFVGGINFSIDQLAGSGPDGKQDYAVEVAGPLVVQIRAFCRANLRQPEPRQRQRWPWQRRRRHLWPRAGRANGALATFVTRDNRVHRTDIEHQYRAALRGARQRVVIATAYFFPGWRLLNDLRRAARRGVQVDLLLQGRPDMAWVQMFARLLYGHLMRAGVQVREYRERPLHAKVAVVDDVWATVGSSNLDPFSLGLNLEANVFVRDRAFACRLRERLDHLITQHSQRVQMVAHGRLASAWIALRSLVVFHFLRRFPAWAQRLPDSAPRIAPLRGQP